MLLRRLYHLNVAIGHIRGVRVTNNMHHPHFQSLSLMSGVAA